MSELEEESDGKTPENPKRQTPYFNSKRRKSSKLDEFQNVFDGRLTLALQLKLEKKRSSLQLKNEIAYKPVIERRSKAEKPKFNLIARHTSKNVVYPKQSTVHQNEMFS